MGLDGFSISNLGLHKEFTSAQLASNAEALAKKGTQFSIKNVDSIAEKQKIKEKESDDETQKQELTYSEGEAYENEEDDEEETEDIKKYSVKLNNSSQLIELIDIENEQIIETISPADLIKLVSKLNSTSGILVNKEI